MAECALPSAQEREIVMETEVAVLVQCRAMGITRQSWGGAPRPPGALLGDALQAATQDAMARLGLGDGVGGAPH